MTNPTFDFNAFIDASKKAMAPAVKLNELSVPVSSALRASSTRSSAKCSSSRCSSGRSRATARDFNDLTSRQIELSTQFAERATQRSQDLVKLSTEHQAELTKWFDQAVTETTQTVSSPPRPPRKPPDRISTLPLGTVRLRAAVLFFRLISRNMSMPQCVIALRHDPVDSGHDQGTADQEVRQPAALRRLDQQARHARGHPRPDRAGREDPGGRGQDRARTSPG